MPASFACAIWTPKPSALSGKPFFGGKRRSTYRVISFFASSPIGFKPTHDRLTRSLADFAKLVELFDQHGASFVSVTQHFNTTTSMGRLTLNVLLSFAQFEREVTSERIRDKIAASKRKGIWVGGNVPLGYALKDRKLTIVAKEAELVRTIFRTYLKVKSIDRLSANLRERGVRTKSRRWKDGRVVGGIAFKRGALSYLLRNRFYLGEVVYKGDILPGSQPALLSRKLFEAVQLRLAEQLNNHTEKRSKSEALLMGKIFDDRGTLMGPSHTRKNGRKYRYYISSCLLQGRRDLAGSIHRVPASILESAVASALRKRLPISSGVDDNDLLRSTVRRVDVSTDQLIVFIKRQKSSGRDIKIQVPWHKPPLKRRREILLPSEPTVQSISRPIRSDARARLIAAISRGRTWVKEIISGSVKGQRRLLLARNAAYVLSIKRFLSPS